MNTEEARAAYEHGLHVLSSKVMEANWARNYYSPEPTDVIWHNGSKEVMYYTSEGIRWRITRTGIEGRQGRHVYTIVRTQIPSLKKRKLYRLRVNGKLIGTPSRVAEAMRKAEIHLIQNGRS